MEELDRPGRRPHTAISGQGKHAPTVHEAVRLLRKHFLDDETTDGPLKDGPVAVAKFEIGELEEDTEARMLRQREASFAVESILLRL